MLRNDFFKITGEERDSERHISLRSPSGEVEGWVHVEQVAAHARALYSVWEREEEREEENERERASHGGLREAVMAVSRDAGINGGDRCGERGLMAAESGWSLF